MKAINFRVSIPVVLGERLTTFPRIIEPGERATIVRLEVEGDDESVWAYVVWESPELRSVPGLEGGWFLSRFRGPDHIADKPPGVDPARGTP